MDYTHLLVEQQDAVLHVTINRPDVLNALNEATLDELERALATEAVRDDVRALIITGSGERAFVAGADIAEMSRLTPHGMYKLMRRGHDLFGRLARLPKPTVAAVGGFCLGGGLELALACDIRIACPEARFGLPEITLGIVPGWGGTKRLADAVGPGRARELIMTGRMIDGTEAERIGLAQRLAPSRAELPELARTVAEGLAAYSPTTMEMLKGALAEAPALSWDALAEMEARSNAFCLSTEDGREGLAAFVEKRTPRFHGR